MSLFKAKPTKSDATSGPPAVLVDEEMIAFFPTIWEYLAVSRYEDGQERQTSTLLLFVEDDRVKMVLNDREGTRGAWVAGGSVREALESLEGQLASGEMEWRRKPVYAPGKGGKRS